jgi:AbrB family looped-hinge helix DNA binding protein
LAIERIDEMRKRSGRLGECYGTTTVSERGQIVIPAEARRELGIECGTKLLVFRSGSMGGHGLVLMTAGTVTEFVRDAVSRLTELERTVLETAEGEER